MPPAPADRSLVHIDPPELRDASVGAGGPRHPPAPAPEIEPACIRSRVTSRRVAEMPSRRVEGARKGGPDEPGDEQEFRPGTRQSDRASHRRGRERRVSGCRGGGPPGGPGENGATEWARPA